MLADKETELVVLGGRLSAEKIAHDASKSAKEDISRKLQRVKTQVHNLPGGQQVLAQCKRKASKVMLWNEWST